MIKKHFTFKRFHLLCCLLLLTSNGIVYSQELELYGGPINTGPFSNEEKRLIEGDVNALFDLAKYFDSKQKRTEFLGHHILETTEAEIAHRLVRENTSFLPEEIDFTDQTSATEFTAFLEKHKAEFTFSPSGKIFVLTPLENRSVNYKVAALSDFRKKELEPSVNKIMKLNWVTENRIDQLIVEHNPQVLLRLAEELFHNRNRFNSYNPYKEEYTDLLEWLTGTTVMVENEKSELTAQVAGNYEPTSKRNLLIYFLKYGSGYVWDSEHSVFRNPSITIETLEQEHQWFELLYSKENAVAMDAFIHLTEAEPDKVIALVDNDWPNHWDMNDTLPTFSLKFLKQLSQLTAYCRKNQIDYKGSKALNTKINRLMTRLSFPERRALENELIATMTLEDVTALEYWTIVNEHSWELIYSSGRILDVFYSNHWAELLNNPKHLNAYLKKSGLFNNLGIIGTCNNYLIKFAHASPEHIATLEAIHTTDVTVMAQVQRAITTAKAPLKWKDEEKKSNWGNYDSQVKNLEEKLKEVMESDLNQDEKDDKLSKLLADISYEQIPVALAAIEHYNFKQQWAKYSFMDRDWGFDLAGNFDDKADREEFLKQYNRFTEYELYAYYLDQNSIDYTTNQQLDYDKIYDLLKYDVVIALIGGGGGRKDNEVYGLVKLLELTFKTTLGYPEKLCNSDNTWGCNSDDRAKAWMNYLEQKKLLKSPHDTPVSFHVESN